MYLVAIEYRERNDIMWFCIWKPKCSGMQRSGDARGDCLIGCPFPNSSIEQWHTYGGHCYWIYAICDVTIWRHIHICKPTFCQTLLTQHAYSGTPEQYGSSPVATRDFWGLSPPNKAPSPPIELWSTIDRSFNQISECQSPLNRRNTPQLKTFLWWFCREGRAVKQLKAMGTYEKKLLPIMFVSVHQQCWPQK